ncbi:alginate export family protein [Leptospira sp. 2 VSF19]|uniref:Alginate export family protein n=1 Tax=Leptospira soteropolitanensis TaxID=2950025 RepID=A0AAW5VHX6_9LEPT|nr:alginate export family protein [Leptospira soteropolitanensis]MCW7493602.1 alginate export family protein [Leptospira soteropolitanensis]MCW7501201.1 alginate export family protein [Leptospira soteropolitanensis]MCW7523613.1 alginate export family protein [Leptospira soteropolitanensis]MCW7527314.1 alginate export family protein [Leptospira soteropolitanensis]MCW7531171.1 alginate export family protein [Leptospira soteropolitanensis]
MYLRNHRIIIGFVSLGILLSPLTKDLDAQFITPVKKEVPQETTPPPPTPPPPPPPPEEPAEYVSPMKGNLTGEYLKSLQITGKQRKALQENTNLWFADRFRVGFGIRPKADSLYNTDFDRSTPDNRNTVSNQTQFFLIGDISPNVTFKLTLQDVRLWGGEVLNGSTDQRLGVISNGGTTIDTSKQKEVPLNNYTGFREAFVDLKTTNQVFRVRTGRQILDFGDGRIIGARNDSLNGNAFDAIRTTISIQKHSIDFFGAVLSSENNANSIVSNNSTRVGGPGNASYYGAHFGFKPWDWLGIDLYNFTLYKQKQKATNTTANYGSDIYYRGPDQLNTTGFRLTNRTKGNMITTETGIDWMVEAAWQTGFTGERVSPDWLNQKGTYTTNKKTGEAPPLSSPVQYKANFVAVQLGFSPVKEFRIGVQYVQASGDPNRNDGSVATYNPLFATRRMAGAGLAFSGNGNSGMVFWQNIKDYSINIKYDSGKWGTFILNPHWYYKVKLQDGYYDNNNYVAGSKATGETASTEDYFNTEAYNQNRPKLGKHVATEINFIYIVTPFENVSFWFGASSLYAGDAIRNQKNNPYETDPYHRYDFKPNSSYFTLQSVFAI